MTISKTTRIQSRRLAVLLRRLALTIYSVEGDYDGQPMRLLVADDNDTLAYIRDFVFPNGATVTRRGTILAPRVPAMLRDMLFRPEAGGKDSLQPDLIIVGCNQLLVNQYARAGFYIVPKFVRQILRINDEPDAIVSRLGKSMRAHIRKAVARWPEYEITTDQSWLKPFYYEMYKPYTLSRFGDDATVIDCDRVKRDFARGSFIVLKQEGKPISAAIVFADGKSLHMPYSGIRIGYEDVARQGAKTAMYYYLMQFAHSHGCTEINLGHSRPFLSDGILRFKLSWGVDVLDDDDGVASFAIAAPGRTEQAAKFLAANPFYHVVNGVLQALEGVETGML